MNKKDILVGLLFLLLTSFIAFAQTDIYDSGGSLMPEQAAYDVTFYDLFVSVNPADSSISGSVKIKANAINDLNYFVIDLDTLFTIDEVFDYSGNKKRKLFFARVLGKVWIELEEKAHLGDEIELTVVYHGKPRVAPRAPWDEGFTWAKTKSGAEWIATTCQGSGADIWWPVKDHVSDEPDSMGIHVNVPNNLVCASNGKLLSVEEYENNTSTYNWFVSNPINSYCVALNIAPYKVIEQNYTSIDGTIIPVKFWVLPEDYEKGKNFMSEIIEHLNFFEQTLGPYPFRADKYGVVQTPYLGMEHQTIIAYGADFDNTRMTGGKDWGFDALHHHELSHEWWGNLLTNADWKDMWLHEGFGTYMQALYVEKLYGIEKYHEFIKSNQRFGEDLPIAPKNSQTAKQIYRAPIYTKGASVLHTLRYLIGSETLNLSLRKMCYPTEELALTTNGKQTRLVDTEDFIEIAEECSRMELNWFFDVYTHQAKLPRLFVEEVENKLHLKWITEDNVNFPMPIDVKVGDQITRVAMTNGKGEIVLAGNKEYEMDPDKWVLYKKFGE